VVISAHLAVRLLLSTINAALLLGVALHLFADPAWSLPVWSSSAIGPAFAVFMLLLLQSAAGLSHGLLVSAICPDLFMAAVLGNGVLLVVFILGGVLWPVLSLPPLLRTISRLLPPTQAAEAIRSLMSRGLDIHQPLVYNGFIVSSVYAISFFILAAFLFRAQR
jgi:ABC-type multidrug transport system permease subunit